MLLLDSSLDVDSKILECAESKFEDILLPEIPVHDVYLEVVDSDISEVSLLVPSLDIVMLESEDPN
jgi:hypothetical protein